MPELTRSDFNCLAKCLEGFLFGIYSGIFAIFLYTTLHKGTEHGKSIVFYALCVLYASSLVTLIVDTMIVSDGLYHLVIIQTILFGCCDFIAQSILIYRCYVVWGNNIRIIIIPSILTFAFLVIWMTGGAAPFKATVEDPPAFTLWAETLLTTSLAMSLTVNALVTGLIMFRIVKLFREVNRTGITQRRSTLQRVIGIIMESGMVLFAVQLARLVTTILSISMDGRLYNGFTLSVCIHQMVNGMTPTIIVVRVSMGLSCHDENSIVENGNSTGGSMHFVPANENESIGIVN